MKAADAILETAIYCDDLEAAERFYTDVFGLEVVRKLEGKFVFFRCGAQMLLVFDPVQSARPDSDNPIPRHGATGAGHICFDADTPETVEQWRNRFEAHGIEIEADHIWDGTGVRSIYIRDPGGNSIEVADRKLWGFA
ncbi:VOC family protein [Qingshengfaniella alkalisoli]|uniref:Lactoylglutathione lyase n=1 Tax=Qingshengfaniella alkalisoli TaxID=2599296 RepID=A0A5B8J2Y0_9RHOB|nr:VOC family protein [Qingshengfaniella alkalisoli]QDY68620.1 lactoylglutathione lyase [Qingshengfaniella alkalisoli]